MRSKKKLFIGCIMSLIMALVLAVPVSVGAEEAAGKPVANQEELIAALADSDVSVITVGSQIKVTQSIAVTRDVTIKGTGSIDFENVKGNSFTVQGNASVSLEGVTLSNDASGKYVLHVYDASLTAKDITLKHGGAEGSPVLVNHNSIAEFDGLIMELNPASWYGVNVDGSKAAFNNISVTGGTSGTQSVICEEDNGTVEGSDLTIVKTADGQTAYVEDSNLPAFVKAKTEGGKDITEIILQKDVTLEQPLYLGEAMAVNGNGHWFNGSDSIGKDNVVTVTAEGVTLSDVKIKTSAANKSALHVYKVPATIENVTLDNTETVGGAGLVVNSATVTVEGTLDIKVGKNSWGGINVDARYADAGVMFADGSEVKYETPDGSKPAMYEESQPGYSVTVENAEGAGLVENSNGTYSPAEKENPSETPGEDNPSQTPSTGNNAGDNAGQGGQGETVKADDTPKTGDDMQLGTVIALMTAAAAAAVGTLVCRRRHSS